MDTAWGPEPEDVLVFNGQIEEDTKELPPLWEAGIENARTAREEGRSVFGELTYSPIATADTIPGPAGPIPIRVFRPETIRGIYLHIHGGGWMLGAAHHHDAMTERLARECEMAVVSVDYRLAPEHPYPAGPDDCEVAALWLTEHSETEFGTNHLTIGGESAGAHLAAVTMLRLRDRHGLTPFQAANLAYGMFDLNGTPSVRSWGDRPLILTTPLIEFFVESFGGDPNDPDVSPIFADLAGLGPALFTVGTLDPLLDDSLFMSRRWLAAGNDMDLSVWPGAIHAFDYFDTAYGRSARDTMHAFLRNSLAG